MLSHGCWLILSTIEFHKNEITWGRTHNICLDFSRSSKIASWLNYRGQKIEEMRCFALTRMQQTKIYKYQNCILRIVFNGEKSTLSVGWTVNLSWTSRAKIGFKIKCGKTWTVWNLVTFWNFLEWDLEEWFIKNELK